VSIRESLVAEVPEDFERMMQLAGAYYWLGHCCGELGETEEAIAQQERSCEIHTRIIKRQPDVADVVLGLTEAQINLAAAYMGLRTPEGDAAASDYLAQAESRLEQLHNAGRLVGLERRYTRRMDAIRANQRILRKWAEERARQDSLGAPPG